MSFKSKVKSDNKEFNQLMNRLRKLETYSVEYGYYDEDIHQDSGKGMATLAAIHEFGDGQIPERPFISQSEIFLSMWYETSNRWKVCVNQFLRDGGRIDTFLKTEGLRGVDAIQTVINRQDFDDNEKWWTEFKKVNYKYNDILRATGQLYEGARVKVINNAKT